MPNYTSHIIMATDFYNTLIDDLKIYVPSDDIILSSIGQDFTFFNAKLFDKTHTEKVQCFFLNLITYIKKNKLFDNPKIMAYLYGQIAHFSLDSTVHPFIYAKEKETNKVTIFPPHTTVEYFIDDYLKEISNNDDKLDSILKSNNFLDNEINLMINEVYGKTYSQKKVNTTYKKTFKAIKALHKVSKLKINNKLVMNLLLKYNTYFDKNNINEEFILNNNNTEWINPFSGKIKNDSLKQLYQQSIIKSLELSNETNEFLYNNKSLDKIKLAFPDISYDTGIECNKGKVFKYIKKSK